VNAWDEIENRLLSAVQAPHTARQIIDATGLPADTVHAQLDLMRRNGLVIDDVAGGGVRYQLTLKGRRRLAALAAPDTKAA
jgi:DNA-binding IclR family transcriptional regulator